MQPGPRPAMRRFLRKVLRENLGRSYRLDDFPDSREAQLEALRRSRPRPR